MANGIGAVGRELTETEKVQARYGLLMEATAKTQGDFANTSDGLANGMRILKATIADTQAEIGTALLPSLQALVPAITPIVQQLAPVLTRIFETLGPFIVKLTENLGPLLDAFMPLLDVFDLFVGAFGEILAQLLPPLIEIFGVLTPVVLKLVDAFLPLIMAILPPLVRLITALIPVIELVATWIGDYWVPIFSKIAEAIMPVVVYLIDLFARALEDLNTVLGPVFAALKPVMDALLAIAGIKPGDLNKTVTVTTKTSGLLDSEARRDAAIAARNASGAFVPGVITEEPVITGGTTGTDARAEIKKAIGDARKAIKSARKEYDKTVKDANKEFSETSAKISEDFSISVAKATIRRDQELADALVDNTKRVASIRADFAKRLDDIIKTSMQRLRDAYKSAVEINVADIFNGDIVAGSIDGTIEVFRRKLTASRQLLANAASLAAAGFSQTFIEQVVGAGTDVGNELAQGILNATPQQQAELRELFGAIETEAATGMDSLSQTIYEKNGLATQELKNLYADTQAELVVALADQEALYQQSILDIKAQFDQAILDAKTSRDEALKEAEKTLQDALLKANENFVEDMKTIKKAFKEQIKEMKGLVSGMSAEISGLMSQISSAQAAAAAAKATGAAIPKSGAKVPFAKGGLVTGPTNALIGEAGPELVIPLDRFESWMNMSGSGKAVNYYAAPNQSLDSEQELFQAMKRAKVVVGW